MVSLKNVCKECIAKRKIINVLIDFFSMQLKTYEDDFRRETEDKNQIKKKFESKEQENERMRRENQSHTATIRHFESEVRNTLLRA